MGKHLTNSGVSIITEIVKGSAINLFSMAAIK
jgi:hypothetical protein